MTQKQHAWITAACLGAAAGLAAAQGTTTVTFDGGDTGGWQGIQGIGGSSFVDDNDGNGAPAYHTVFNNFGIYWTNDSNPAFVQDLTQWQSVTISIDVKVNDISMLGMAVSRPFFVEFRDYDNGSSYPWDSVWFKFDDISAATYGEWTTLSVTFDPSQMLLPAGWGGYGDEDPNTFEPILPAHRTFADILATYDEIAFSTLEPGFFFGFTDFDVLVDNISITVVPAPTGVAALAAAGLIAGRRRRA